ncbi:hypothetical protein Golax_019465 [Gossypium laxum]|uniref:Uncharacterized protein n=1 Tax=Gossypium laxum TaxID=34288 RepID=A0A7J8Z6E0_9ROSI|nr:hypothetical protein [Gossypium laxum]
MRRTPEVGKVGEKSSDRRRIERGENDLGQFKRRKLHRQISTDNKARGRYARMSFVSLATVTVTLRKTTGKEKHDAGEGKCCYRYGGENQSLWALDAGGPLLGKEISAEPIINANKLVNSSSQEKTAGKEKIITGHNRDKLEPSNKMGQTQINNTDFVIMEASIGELKARSVWAKESSKAHIKIKASTVD